VNVTPRAWAAGHPRRQRHYWWDRAELMPMGGELRAILDEMTSEPGTVNHPARLEELRHGFHHTIDVLPSSHSISTYNCVIHALGMIDLDIPVWYARTAFVAHLIATGKLEVSEPRPGALVVWSAGGQVKHIGKLITTQRSESKWGHGLLFAHALNEIPIRYGEVSGFYAPITSAQALDHFNSFYSR
jgi:hypothetical protein